MVVRNLNLGRPCLGPDKADAILLVDSDTELTGPVPGQSLKPAPGRDPEFVDADHGIQLVELSARQTPDVSRTNGPSTLGVSPVEEIFGARVRKRPDHNSMIARISCYVKLRSHPLQAPAGRYFASSTRKSRQNSSYHCLSCSSQNRFSIPSESRPFPPVSEPAKTGPA